MKMWGKAEDYGNTHRIESIIVCTMVIVMVFMFTCDEERERVCEEGGREGEYLMNLHLD